MQEQGSTGWGLTVSRRFDKRQQADQAVQQLKQTGFRDEQMRVWQHRNNSFDQEDRLARTVEGLLAGGVIGGLLGLFFSAAISWAGSSTITEESVPGLAIGLAVGGAIFTAIGVNIVSRRFSFSHEHGHESHDEPPTVVTVTVGDRAADARKVFDGLK